MESLPVRPYRQARSPLEECPPGEPLSLSESLRRIEETGFPPEAPKGRHEHYAGLLLRRQDARALKSTNAVQV